MKTKEGFTRKQLHHEKPFPCCDATKAVATYLGDGAEALSIDANGDLLRSLGTNGLQSDLPCACAGSITEPIS